MAEEEEKPAGRRPQGPSRCLPLADGVNDETRGCVDGIRDSQLENELRMWKTSNRGMRHDYTLQSLMEGAAQSPAIKMHMQRAPDCDQHPFLAAWYWRHTCRKCARVYQAMPACLVHLRDKLHTPLRTLDNNADVLRRSASMIAEPKVPKPEPPPPFDISKPKPTKRWVPSNYEVFGTEFTGLLTPSLLAPDQMGHWVPISDAGSRASSGLSRAPTAPSAGPQRSASLGASKSVGTRASGSRARSAASLRSTASVRAAAQDALREQLAGLEISGLAAGNEQGA
jgi:hypothetical protein